MTQQATPTRRHREGHAKVNVLGVNQPLIISIQFIHVIFIITHAMYAVDIFQFSKAQRRTVCSCRI